MPRIKLTLPESFAFTTHIALRIGDINYGGHMGNDAVLSIMHEARVQFLKHYGCTEMDVFGASVIMSDVAIMFKAEGFYGDKLQVDVTPAEFTRVGFDLYYRVRNAESGAEIAHGKTGMVCFDYKARMIKPVPDEFVKLFQAK